MCTASMTQIVPGGYAFLVTSFGAHRFSLYGTKPSSTTVSDGVRAQRGAQAPQSHSAPYTTPTLLTLHNDMTGVVDAVDGGIGRSGPEDIATSGQK